MGPAMLVYMLQCQNLASDDVADYWKINKGIVPKATGDWKQFPIFTMFQSYEVDWYAIRIVMCRHRHRHLALI